MKEIRITAMEFRKRFSHWLNMVSLRHTIIIITKKGKEIAVLLPLVFANDIYKLKNPLKHY